MKGKLSKSKGRVVPLRQERVILTKEIREERNEFELFFKAMEILFKIIPEYVQTNEKLFISLFSDVDNKKPKMGTVDRINSLKEIRKYYDWFEQYRKEHLPYLLEYANKGVIEHLRNVNNTRTQFSKRQLLSFAKKLSDSKHKFIIPVGIRTINDIIYLKLSNDGEIYDEMAPIYRFDEYASLSPKALNQHLERLQQLQVEEDKYLKPVLGARSNDFINRRDDIERLIDTVQNDINVYLENEVKYSCKDSVCPICIEKFEIGERIVKTNCGHCFHPECFIPWFRKNNSCPLCRTELDNDEFIFFNVTGIDDFAEIVLTGESDVDEF